VARFALGQLGKLNGGVAGLADAALSLTGAASTPQVFNDVMASLRAALPQGFSLARADVAPPAVDPYVWSAVKAGNALTLSGFVPSEAMREALAGAARAAMPGATVSDRMQVAAGAPAPFEALARFGLTQLGRLTNGAASLSGTAFSIAGTAPSPIVHSEVSGAVRLALPQGGALARADIAPPTVSPYTWSAQRDGAGVTVSGHVPSEAARSAAIAALRAAVPGAAVTDRQVIASGQPDNFDAMVAFGARQLGRLQSGTASIAANAYSIAGAAATFAVRTEVVSALNALPPGFILGREAVTSPPPVPVTPPVAVAPPAPPALPQVSVPIPEAPQAAVVAIARAVPASDPCQAALSEILREPILFAVNRADIDARSYLVVNRLANAANACPTRMIEIGAHTDSDGEDEANMELSRRRAESVVEFLVRDGVERRRLIATGFGRMRPVAPNDTSENKARNRRVEFTVLDQEPPPPTPADVCQARFRELLSEPILFATASAEIDARSYLLLGRIAQTAQSCPSARIEVGAHTDSDGSEAGNLELSRRRADAVLEYLVREGVERGRLSSAGYGQSRPIAPNDTAENKARNRRVDFVVR
jgi:OOP family OmpA-OmpF porin